MLKGFEGDRTHRYDVGGIEHHLVAYDQTWRAYEWLRRTRPSCASLYEPYGFGPRDPQGLYNADQAHGMKPSVDRYRPLIPVSEATSGRGGARR
jgi:hypothetical protein